MSGSDCPVIAGPVSDLYNQVWSADRYQPDLTSLRYVESSSFARYLVRRYGVASYLNAYQNNGSFEMIYGKTLAQLEQGWVRSLRTGNLVQVVAFTLSGAAILGLVTLSILRGWRWIPAAVTGWRAFISWGWYAYYPALIVPGGLLILAVIGGLVAHWRRRLGLWLLWSGGTATLAGFLLAPALLLFFH